MFANASMSSTDMSPVLSRLAEVSRHFDGVVLCCDAPIDNVAIQS